MLVLTDRFDPTADAVVTELNRRETRVFRCDIGEFPTELAVTAELAGDQWRGHAQSPRRRLDLTNVAGLYYRRPTAFVFDQGMSVEERRWASVQARLGFGGLLATLEPWLNHPHNVGYAEYKPVQLHVAVQCGLRVPRALITNEPEAARAFVAEVGDAVYKPFGGTAAFTDTDGVHQVFATRVTAEQAGSPSVAHTMHLFQQWVPKDHEVRLTVVDDQFFAARIDARSEAAYVDWRADYRALDYSVIDTPDSIRAGVSTLLTRFGLRFGALDFVVTPDGEWWYLDLNPNGQWAWIEEETGLPITSALADALEGRTNRDR